MGKIILESCPLCGQQHLHHFLDCKDYTASGETFALWKCDDCGFVFTQGFPDESEIGRYYEAPSYISHSDTHKGVVNKLYHVARSFMLSRKTGLVRRLSGLKHGRLLDYGAGTGYFAHAMSRKGWEVQAVEKSAQARQFALEHFKLRLSDVPALDTFAPGSFDVITLWHVMEHVQELDVLWQKLNSLLSDHGILVVAVPNCASLDALHYKNFWAAYDVPRHLWHFTPGTMLKWGAKYGFILERHYRMPLDAFYISMLSEKYRKSPMGVLRGLNRGFACLFGSLGRKSWSSSVIYVFRK